MSRARYREYSFEDAWTALEDLIANGYVDDMQTLLGAHAALRAHLKVTDPPVYPGNLLMTALRNDTNSLAKVRCLLSHGVDPDAPNHRGRTALAHLFDTGSGFSPAIVEALLAAGANPNGTAAGAPFLVRAVQYSRHEVVVALLDAGADPNAAFQGTVPLAMAIKDNRLGLVPPLLAAGASPEHAALVDPGFDPGALERPASGLNAPRAMGMRP